MQSMIVMYIVSFKKGATNYELCLEIYFYIAFFFMQKGNCTQEQFDCSNKLYTNFFSIFMSFLTKYFNQNQTGWHG